MRKFPFTGEMIRSLGTLILLAAICVPAGVSRAGDGFFIPDSLTFCGEKVPLERPDVRERLEIQLRVYAFNTAQVKLWAKRRNRFFPVITPLLKQSDMPEDLKYVPVIESGLQNRAYSPKSAVGPWQFIPGTARKHGLRVDGTIDDRLDTRKSTRSAIRYLKSLHAEFGSWATALAAYNIGENRIRKETYRQGTSNYYEMLLPNETDRYVFNILAAKIIFENSEKYGITLENLEGFRDIESVSIPLHLSAHIPVKILAFCSGLSYREFRSLNPWMVGVDLPAGKYHIRVPVPERKGFESRLFNYTETIRKLVKLRHKRKLEVTSEIGEMRIAPSTNYPIFRQVSKGDTFNVRWRTATRDRGHYWYLFKRKNGATGWIWGGQVK